MKSSIKGIAPGGVYGRYTVLERVQNSRPTKFLCKCECGTVKEAIGHLLASGKVRSCGCLQHETRRRTDNKFTTHGEARKGALSSTYNAWSEMRERVAGNPRYAHLSIDPSWDDYLVFKRDMGERPDGGSLDRIDGELGYGPSNCRWATRQEQQRNTKNNVYLTVHGQRKLLIEWANEVGMSYHTLWSRVKAGWPHEKAVLESVDYSKASSRKVIVGGES